MRYAPPKVTTAPSGLSSKTPFSFICVCPVGIFSCVGGLFCLIICTFRKKSLSLPHENAHLPKENLLQHATMAAHRHGLSACPAADHRRYPSVHSPTRHAPARLHATQRPPVEPAGEGLCRKSRGLHHDRHRIRAEPFRRTELHTVLFDHRQLLAAQQQHRGGALPHASPRLVHGHHLRRIVHRLPRRHSLDALPRRLPSARRTFGQPHPGLLRQPALPLCPADAFAPVSPHPQHQPRWRRRTGDTPVGHQFLGQQRP